MLLEILKYVIKVLYCTHIHRSNELLIVQWIEIILKCLIKCENLIWIFKIAKGKKL